jgi:streptomycin 6-kinase
VPQLPIPDRLLAGVGDDPGSVHQDWIDALPQVLQDVGDCWSLRVGRPFDPGGRCSWTAPAWDARGAARVLKLGWLHDEATHEATALRTWAGRGAVRLHRAEIFGQTSALLLERCSPGTALAAAVAEDEQDEIIAGLLLRLWTPIVDGTGIRPLQDMCDRWATEYETAAPTRGSAVDRGLERLALEMFRELPRTAGRRVLLCTDLHAENVLSALREPWLAIDPKPYDGDPTYDVLQHMLNCEQRLRSDPAGLSLRMAGLLGLEAERVMRWLFCRALLDPGNRPWLQEVARRVAP